MSRKNASTAVVSGEAGQAGGEYPLDKDMDCRGCGSDQHTPYADVRREPIDGQLIIWRRCQCKHCGQHRSNRFAIQLPEAVRRKAAPRD